MPRSRVQQRLSTCSSLIAAFILAGILGILLFLNHRQPRRVAVQPSPTPTPTFISRTALPVAPTPTLPFSLPELPTFTPTPTATATPTITPTPTATPTPIYTARVTAELVNLRSEPHAESQVLTILARDEEVDLVGKLADQPWTLVRTAAGQRGWIYSEFLQPEPDAVIAVITPPPTPTPSPPHITVELANLRTGPGLEYDLITMLPLGTIFVPEARDASGEWVFGATPQGQQGWLFIQLLSQVPYLNSLPVQPAPPPPTPAT